MPPSSLPTTMRVVRHIQSTQILSFDPQHPLPTPNPDEYLLAVSATAITTGELIWPRPPHLDTSHPGVEMSGTIISTPLSLSQPKFHPGDKVYMRTIFPDPGSAREYSTTKEPALALRPANLSAVEAAAVPVAALTAWQGLFVQAGLSPNFTTAPSTPLRILINGASSATGLVFSQLASLAGHTVTGTCSGKNVALVRSMGASHVIDYTTTAVPASSFDLVFDCAGVSPLLWQSLAPHGTLYTIVPPFDVTRPEEWRFDFDAPEGCSEGVKGKLYIMEPKGEDLEKITRLIEEGKVKVAVDSVWELEEYEKAFERLKSGRAVGKVVMKVSDE